MADLTDREAVNRAVAEALHGRGHAWWCPTCCHVLVWQEVTNDERHDERVGGGCGNPVSDPPYLPADGSEASAELCREMLDKLRAALGHEGQVRIEYGRDWFVLELLTDAPALHSWGSHSTQDTEAEALVRALIAAGVVELPVYIEPKADHGRDRTQEV